MNRYYQDNPELQKNLFVKDALISMFPGERINPNHMYSIKVRYTKEDGGPGRDKERWFRVHKPGTVLQDLQDSERAIADIFGNLNDDDNYG